MKTSAYKTGEREGLWMTLNPFHFCNLCISESFTSALQHETSSSGALFAAELVHGVDHCGDRFRRGKL